MFAAQEAAPEPDGEVARVRLSNATHRGVHRTLGAWSKPLEAFPGSAFELELTGGVARENHVGVHSEQGRLEAPVFL